MNGRLSMRSRATGGVVGILLVAGCSTGTETVTDADTSTALSTTASSTTASSSTAAAGEVAVSGNVANPTTLTLDDLRGLPQSTEAVVFESSQGVQQHTYDGAALRDIVDAAAPSVDADAKNPLLTVAIVGVGSDGYAATVAWGEISPDFAATDVLVAHTEDGVALEQPRLVVPGDVKGGRYVSDLVELRIVDTR